ncbi:MAG: metallophosphoesterase [Prevotella sp.]|nr:metallophosphoesterase [Prevotella sp.]
MRQYIFLFSLLFSLLSATAQKAVDYNDFKGKFNFIVCNDNGRNGFYDHKTIAETMGRMAEEGVKPEFVMALGDIHHFNGVQSVSDPLWMTNYEMIYSHPELMIDWFSICGNHEYRGNTQACIDYSNVSRRWEMREKYYTKLFSHKGMTMRLIWLDTTPLIQKYRDDSNQYPDAYKQDDTRQLAWLDSVLTISKEDWVIVGGHHPIYAETSKDDSERTDMQQRVDNILRRHHVDFYINGHIHNFQHIRRPGSDIDYVTNSSASLARKVNVIEGTVFCSSEPGFTIVSANKNGLTLRFIDKNGKELHSIHREK